MDLKLNRPFSLLENELNCGGSGCSELGDVDVNFLITECLLSVPNWNVRKFVQFFSKYRYSNPSYLKFYIRPYRCLVWKWEHVIRAICEFNSPRSKCPEDKVKLHLSLAPMLLRLRRLHSRPNSAETTNVPAECRKFDKNRTRVHNDKLFNSVGLRMRETILPMYQTTNTYFTALINEFSSRTRLVRIRIYNLRFVGGFFTSTTRRSAKRETE